MAVDIGPLSTVEPAADESVLSGRSSVEAMDLDDDDGGDRDCEHVHEYADAAASTIDGEIDGDERHPVLVLTEFADRLDHLAATADLMGDDYTAGQWRAKANEVRLRAMSRLDDD